MVDTTVARSTKGPPFRPSLITLLAGIAVALPGFVVVSVAMASLLFGATTRAVPSTLRLDLSGGEYKVFERTGRTDRVGVLTFGRFHGPTIDRGDVRVEAEDGSSVPVRDVSPNETVTLNDEQFVSVVSFDIPHSGRYVVRVEPERRTEVIVQHPLGQTLSARSGWIALTVAGWLVALVGVTMLLVGVIRRGRDVRRARRALAPAAAAAVAPPGWYADPHGQHHWRYWDGARWTEHTG